MKPSFVSLSSSITFLFALLGQVAPSPLAGASVELRDSEDLRLKVDVIVKLLEANAGASICLKLLSDAEDTLHITCTGCRIHSNTKLPPFGTKEVTVTTTSTKVVLTTETSTTTEIVTHSPVAKRANFPSRGAANAAIAQMIKRNDTRHETAYTEQKFKHAQLPIYLENFKFDDVIAACNCLDASLPCITKVIPRTTVSSTTTVVVTSTKTETAIAAATDYSICRGNAYNTTSNGVGNNVEFVEATDALDCCNKCQERLNCVANVFVGKDCEHLIKTQPLDDAEKTAQCPLGVEDYPFGTVLGDVYYVYPGPCGY